ncbi:MAG: TVP38/TMEM64 family protein [Thermodesulfobacteriota bacterium]
MKKQLTPEEQRRVIVSVVALACLAAGIGIAAALGYLQVFLAKLCEIFQGREQLRAYLESWGVWAPAAFVGIQILQVVIAPIPGELSGAVGGFMFDAWPNVIYSTIGLTAGSVLAFLSARIVGQPLVNLVVTDAVMKKLKFLTERRGTMLALFLFTVPGFPKDILCYILGLSPMGFLTFVVVCAVGRIPGTIALSLSGSALYHGNWLLLGIVSVVTGASLLVAYLYRNRIELMLHRKRHAVHEEGASR